MFLESTIIITSRRVSIAQYTDRVLVMHEGRMVEMGKHFDLLAKKGRYYTMATQQSKSNNQDTWSAVWNMGQRRLSPVHVTES